MNIYNDVQRYQFNQNNYLTVGTFDGVHRGHRFLLDQLIALSKQKKLEPTVVTFEPHPQLVLQHPDKESIHLLNSTEEKLRLFKQIGIENVYIIPFTKEFSELSSDQFVEKYLINKIGLKGILIGYDHGFGKDREGDLKTLQNICGTKGIEVGQLSEFSIHEQKVSSTQVRSAISSGDLKTAMELLGYPYHITGTVVHGSRRGRQLGFPTANIHITNENKLIPGFGVYAVVVAIHDTMYHGMANIGKRPTFDGENTSFEVHLFDFQKEIYQQKIEVFFINRQRQEKKFNGPDKLIQQLKKDKFAIETYLNNFIHFDKEYLKLIGESYASNKRS